jgi:predicted nucleotidyltransferase
MNELTRLGLELQKFCEDRNWSFCIIGGLAVQHWSEPRFTKDVDITLLTGFGGEEGFIDAILANYESRVSDAREFALRQRVLLLRSSEGIGIDIALGALPFEEQAVRRAKKIEVEQGAALRLCTAEDLLVMKAFAGRAIDWNDVRGILVRQGTKQLDWRYIRRHLQPLSELKEAPEIMTTLESLRREVAESEPG